VEREITGRIENILVPAWELGELLPVGAKLTYTPKNRGIFTFKLADFFKVCM
jgi:hypothetical protein